ncbi:MAG: SDR family NAD(P)-dependent oxidoreductase [Schleiferilactobacillus perolens]|uniref:SDR family NAD(P)-dependent oxidoreductase n=1 Tax=Schleiferilactobacillus perolens TaxID=100468 RepID=UPI0039E9AA83
MDTSYTLITGGDKGIGLETAKELGLAGQHILLGARRQARGEAAIKVLHRAGVSGVDLILLDVTQEATIQAAARWITAQFGQLNVLINNAGIALDHHESPVTMPLATIRADFEVNFFGAVAVTQAMIPLLRKGAPAKIINVSSEMGSLTNASDPHSRFYRGNALGYQSSKAALNMATVSFSKALAPDHISVNAVNPGHTATDFGGGTASGQAVTAGAAPIVALARSDAPHMTGKFIETAGQVPW